MLHQCIAVIPALSVFKIKKGHFAFAFSFIRLLESINLFIFSEEKTSRKLLIKSLLLFQIILCISKFDILAESIIITICYLQYL